jgi:GTP cyclohydrolase IA
VEPEGAEIAIKLLLDSLGVDEGEHTAETPQRVARAWRQMLWGYNECPDDHLLKTFPGPEDPGLVVQSGIDIQSTCAHHLLPILGTATVAYRPKPGQRIVGLSKLARLTYGYAARLQVQERIGFQVADAIQRMLRPAGSIAVLTCTHDCMRIRGVRSPASVTTTEALRGELSESDIALVRQLHSRREY